jgi:N-acetylated-alpha-linked acidic dipeptidase
MYDGFAWMNRIGDPGYRYHVLLSRIWGTLALRLADADLLPFDFEAYARHLRVFVDELEQATEKGRLDLSRVRVGVDAFEAAGRRLNEATRRALSSGTPPPDLARRVNRDIREVERNWLDPDGLPGRPWFKHTLYAARYTYAHLELPGVTEAAEEKDWERSARQATVLERALARNSALLDGLSKELSTRTGPSAPPR